MDNLPVEFIRKIYEDDNISKIKFGKVLKQLTAHCFIYNCHICFKPWNNCCCYCEICRTYLNFCHHIFYDEKSTYEDELNDVIQLGLCFEQIIHLYFCVLLGLLNFILKE